MKKTKGSSAPARVPIFRRLLAFAVSVAITFSPVVAIPSTVAAAKKPSARYLRNPAESRKPRVGPVRH